MAGKDKKRLEQSPWSLLLAILCVFLILVAGTAQVAHTHADGTDTHADCSLCTTAHVSSQLVQTPTPAPPATIISRIESKPETAVPISFSTFALFIRPPPAA